MNETVTIPKAEYDRLCALEEELSDIHAALAVEARIARGEEELIPARIVDQLIDGEPPLRVWREFRDQSQAALARASGVNRDTNRRHRSRPQQWVRSTPSASWPTRLRVAVDDLIPASPETSKRGQ